MDITLDKIGQRDRKIPIPKLVRYPGKIGPTAWQNWSDVTKIGSATVCVKVLQALLNFALGIQTLNLKDS
jgi:hypothetical protein